MIFEYRAKEVYKGEWVYGDLYRTNPEPDSTSSYKINNNLINSNTISIYLNHKDNITMVPEKDWWINNINDITVIGNMFDNKELLNGLTYDDIITLFL